MLFVANWKANKTTPEAASWLDKLATAGGTPLAEFLETHRETQIIIAAPFTALFGLNDHLTKAGLSKNGGCLNPVRLAAQDISVFPPGAYTGEEPAELLAETVTHCLIGHSERRKYFGEATETVGKKLDRAVQNRLVPIVCAQKLSEIPENIHRLPPGGYLVMYEPFEAISTEGQYHPESPETVSKTLAEWQEKLPAETKFLYGGSVNPQNARQFTDSCPRLTGFVIGHASLEPDNFFAIIKKCS